MSAWGTRRQLSFVLFFILLLALAVVLLIIANRHVPTCRDNQQNQTELGPDCGGPCVKVCPAEVGELVVLWTRLFKIRDGVYDVAAYVENPNPFGILDLPYHIRVYDADNIPIKDVDGNTYLNPHERTLILIPQINVGFREPTRAFISFPEGFPWIRISEPREPTFTITNQRIEEGPILSLRATLTNDSLFAITDIELAALLFDSTGNVTHVSRTFVEGLKTGDSETVVFTWPGGGLPVFSADILPRVNLVKENAIQGDTMPPQ